jgi:GNAT superfamily N-acetyltransferase
MSIRIQDLTEQYLQQACDLVDRCFPGELVHPHLTVQESMDKTHHLRPAILKEYGEMIDGIDYWIAVNEETDRVVGTSGLYMDMHDENEAAWMEWFCVDPDARGLGAGHLLLEKAIDEARKRGKKYLRLYTFPEDHEPTVAHRMYEHRGFVIYKKEPDPTRGNLEKWYMEKTL